MGSGQLVSWRGERATARGLDDIALGDIVSIDGAGRAIVCELRDGEIELAPLTTRVPAAGAGVRPMGRHVVPAGLPMIGRSIDATGEPLDARGPLRCDTYHRVFGRDPSRLPAVAQRRLTFGMLVLDLPRSLALGTSMVVTGPREIAHHVMCHQHAADRVCVVATPAASRRTYLAARRPVLPTIHVTAADDASTVQQWLVPWTALAIADGLREQGHDVIVLIDDLDSWRPHLAHGLPRGSWATQLAQLGSRAYATDRGSVSLLARIATPTPAVAAAFDTSLELDLAVLGHPPARATKLVRPPIRVPSPQLLARPLLDAAQLADLERYKPWLRAHPKLDLTTRRVINAGQKARECLRYRDGMPIDCLEQIACALAVNHVLDLPAEAVGAFIDAYVGTLRKEHALRLAAIRSAGVLGDDDQRALLALAVTTAAPFLLS